VLATALATACTIWNSLQVVGVSDVPLHGVLDGVGAGEELLAGLLLVGAGVGIHVLIQKLPHVVGEVQDLEVLGVLESSLELLGNSSVESGLLHDLADEPLLAVQVVVVELLVDILEHGDPGDDVQAIEESLVVGPIDTLIISILVSVGAIGVVVIPVVGTGSSSAGKDEVGNDSNQDGGSQQGKGLSAAGRVKEEKPGAGIFGSVNVKFVRHGRTGHGSEATS